MNDKKGRKNPQGTSNQRVEVKPQGEGVRADSFSANQLTESLMFPGQLMEEICERSNMQAALKRVKRNKGSPGPDGITVEALLDYLKLHWAAIKAALLQGEYMPSPARSVEIPKPGGKGKRKLSILNTVDRLIQQAILQVLQRQWDPKFSEYSCGFRPERSCHQAIALAQSYINLGYHYVVDIDLEKFFDHVCHERLMSKLAAEIEDKRVLKLIRSYLKAGILENGLVTRMDRGTPQGGPLSPFLSNIVLDELDKELESRGHKFVRYADDSNIYVKSKRAGDRVMASITRFINNRLKLKVNQEKSAVDKPQKRAFLGFTFTGGKNPNRRKIAAESLKRFKVKVRGLTRRNQGISLDEHIRRLNIYLRGWKGYYGYCETPSVFRELDGWVRRRLRCIQWKQWKTYKRRKSKLTGLGVGQELAHTTSWSAKGPWRISNTPGVRIALNNNYFHRKGLLKLVAGKNI